MLSDISNAVLFTILGAFLGICLILISSILVPKIINRMTPRIDEERELVRGNRAVAEYYGRVIAAVIIGISIIIAAAIIAGIHGW
ncbi:MAG: hypothetical protein HZC10_02910 [Nitrospirae bacterium]|nr:hypothetical protein [Nitrospirota bacterium]